MRNFQMICSSAVVVLIAMWSVSVASAAQNSECKGLEQQKCTTLASCSWVRSYKTSKGTEVNAFCRRKPVRKQTTQAAPDQPNGT